MADEPARNAQMEANIQRLYKELGEFLLKKCADDNYMAAEIYITLRCYMNALVNALGADKVAQIEKGFILIDKDKIGFC